MGPLSRMVRRTLLRLAGEGPLTDGALLDRFAAHKDQSAFEELVRRHGPMVLQVCQRRLRHAQDAEDAFQAAFMVLARKAATVARMASVAGWLHGVACRIALNVRRNRASGIQTRTLVSDEGRADAVGSAPEDRGDYRQLLADEVGRLPDKYRAPVVLCYLEGKSLDEAAQQLGCKVGAVKVQLFRARERLRDRLARRGVTLASPIIAACLAEAAPAAVPIRLVDAVLAGAMKETAALPPAVAALVKAILEEPTSMRRRAALGILLGGCACLGLGVFYLARSGPRRDLPATRRIDAAPRTILEHAAAVRSLAYFPHGGAVAGADMNGAITIWNTQSGAKRLTLDGLPAYSLAISGDGKILAAGTWIGVVQLWNTENGALLANFFAARSKVVPVTLAPDGKKIAAGEAGTHAVQSLLRVYDVDDVIEQHARQKARGRLKTIEGTFRTYSNDGTPIGERKLQLAGLSEVNAAGQLSGHAGQVRTVKFAPNGRTIASAGFDSTVRLWDIHTEKPRVTLPGHTSAVYTLGFSPDGTLLASGGADRTIRLWDTNRGQERLLLGGHAATIRSVAFSPDGKTLVSGALDGAVKIWDVSTGAELANLAGHQQSVFSVDFAPDGGAVASGSQDRSIILWSLTRDGGCFGKST